MNDRRISSHVQEATSDEEISREKDLMKKQEFDRKILREIFVRQVRRKKFFIFGEKK